MSEHYTYEELLQIIEQQRLKIEELEEAKAKAEHSDRMKSAFLANMSHDIRTPMNAIVGFADILLYAQNNEEREQYVNIIKSNGETLLRLINGVLDLSKIEAGKMKIQMEDLDVITMIHDAITTVSCGLDGKNIAIHTDIPYSAITIHFDRQRFTQLLNNYLSNAVKYTDEGTIIVGVECKPEGLRLWVKDTGIGIAEENFDKVFEKFQKLDTVAQGTGLGLSICKAIAESFDGNVGFNSQLGKGSTFWAWLPIMVEAKELAKDRKDLPILIVEDEESNVKLAKALLRDYTVIHAPNGADAVELMKDHKFALVLMDLRMPILGGVEATKQIREFDKETPIIATTAYSSRKEYAMMAGCNDFITKPLKRDELLSVVGKYLTV